MFPENIYLFNLKNRNTSKMSNMFKADNEDSRTTPFGVVPLSLSLTLNILHVFWLCYYSLQTCKCLLVFNPYHNVLQTLDRGRSRNPATSKTELILTVVTSCQLLTIVTNTSILSIASGI